MKAYILSILLIMATLFNANGAAPKFSTPDFAYPQKVIKSAQKNLDAGLDPLRCMLEIATAERAIDPDTIFTLPASIEKQIAKAKTDADRAMLTAFEAEVYSTIYRESKWKYNRVDAPLMPLPEDISKWSAQQFAHKLNELYDSALKFAKADNKPLADYKDAIEFGKESLDFIPRYLRLYPGPQIRQFRGVLRRQVEQYCRPRHPVRRNGSELRQRLLPGHILGLQQSVARKLSRALRLIHGHIQGQ